MESVIFNCANVFYVLKYDYQQIHIKNGNPICVNHHHYKEYIKSKDLGIVCLSYKHHKYIIMDKNKWFLAKIKYGI